MENRNEIKTSFVPVYLVCPSYAGLLVEEANVLPACFLCSFCIWNVGSVLLKLVFGLLLFSSSPKASCSDRFRRQDWPFHSCVGCVCWVCVVCDGGEKIVPVLVVEFERVSHSRVAVFHFCRTTVSMNSMTKIWSDDEPECRNCWIYYWTYCL